MVFCELSDASWYDYCMQFRFGSKNILFTGSLVLLFLLVAVCILFWQSTREEVQGNKAIGFEQLSAPAVTMLDRRGIKVAELDVGVSRVTKTQRDIGEDVYEVLEQLVITEEVSKSDVIRISLDSELQTRVYRALEEIATEKHYAGGAGVLIDIETGEVLTLVSYENTLSGSENQAKSCADGRPWPCGGINRAIAGPFTPGSTIKPFIALAALAEGVINPEKKILSTGALVVENHNQTGDLATFKDWKAHGYVNMKEAIGVSSNVYFYAIGGGYQDQSGLGMTQIEHYIHQFGFGSDTGIDMVGEREGVVPGEEWKLEKYGDAWRLGDTYLASIGQHGYEVTPLQLARATAAIASGYLVTPRIRNAGPEVSSSLSQILPFTNEELAVVREGMEYAVVNGTASGLYMPGFTLGAKTGTAEVGSDKSFIHSWVTGYFPHDKPKYAFVFMLDHGPWGEETGAVAVAYAVFSWLEKQRPEYMR
jgi:penicillin-binding protein 2